MDKTTPDNEELGEILAAIHKKSSWWNRILSYVSTVLVLAGILSLLVIENNTSKRNETLLEANKKLHADVQRIALQKRDTVFAFLQGQVLIRFQQKLNRIAGVIFIQTKRGRTTHPTTD